MVILGTALDPLADKITMLFIYSAFYLHNDIPSWLFMTIIGRDIALVRHTLVPKWDPKWDPKMGPVIGPEMGRFDN